MSLPEPPKKRNSSSDKAGLVVTVIAVIFIYSQVTGSGTPTVYDGPTTTPSTVTVTMSSCEVADGYATAKVSLTSTKAYSYVGLSGDFTSASGIVIGQGIGNVSNVRPAQPYETEVIYMLSSSGTGGTCAVRADTRLP